MGLGNSGVNRDRISVGYVTPGAAVKAKRDQGGSVDDILRRQLAKFSRFEPLLTRSLIEDGGYVAYDWWLVPVVYAGLSVVLLEARLQRAASQGKKLIFRVSLPLKLLYGGGAIGISIFLYRNWAGAEWWATLLLVVLLISCLVVWPKTIATDERGIECLWWWRRRVFIPWEQVEYAETGKVGAIEISNW